MSSQSGNVSEMLAVSEGVALIPIATLAFSNLPFIKYDKEDVITLSDDEEVHYYSYQNQVDVINQAQETNSQKRQREPDVDSDDTLSSTDQLNSNFSKKSRASDENVYVNRGPFEDEDDDCLIVYEEKDQHSFSTSILASYSINIEETAQKSFDSLSIAEDKCKKYLVMISTLHHQLYVMIPDNNRMEKGIYSLSMTNQNELPCKLIDCEAKLNQLTVALQEKEDEVTALRDEIKALELSFQSTGDGDNSKLSGFKEKIAEYEAAIEELTSENQQMMGEIGTLRTLIHEFSSENQEKDGRILFLENRFNEFQQQKILECDVMKLKVEKLKNQLEEKHAMNFNLSNQMGAFRVQIQELNEEIVILKNQVKDREQVIANMEDPSSDAFSRSVECLKLKERVIELEKDRSNLTVTMTAVVKEKDGHIESLKTNVLSQSTTIDILKAEVDNLKKLISDFGSLADLAKTVQTIVATKTEQDNAQAASTSCGTSSRAASKGTSQSTSPQSKMEGPLAIVDKADLVPNADGVYDKLFPLNEQILRKFKDDGWTAVKFVNQLMDYVFTKDYLCIKTYSKMVPRHREEIIEATLSMYHTFKNRDNIEQLLIRDKVVEFIKQKFSDSKKERFKNENLSARGNQSRRSK